MPASPDSAQAPSNAASMAGTPKRSTTARSACRPTSRNLNSPLSMCTTAVIAIACSTGKNNANAGSNSVPSPNPEKNVRPDASNATVQMTRYVMR